MDLLGRLAEIGALRTGHTAFRNGLHADGWIEKGDLMRDPVALDELAAIQARQLIQRFPEVTLLVGAPACGAVLAAFVGRHLNLPVAFALTGNAAITWHRMHVPAPGQQAVYVDDLICTGRDARAVLAFIRASGHTAPGVSAWLSRSDLAGETLATLSPAPFRTSAADVCPLCAAGEPVHFENVRE